MDEKCSCFNWYQTWPIVPEYQPQHWRTSLPRCSPRSKRIHSRRETTQMSPPKKWWHLKVRNFGGVACLWPGLASGFQSWCLFSHVEGTCAETTGVCCAHILLRLPDDMPCLRKRQWMPSHTFQLSPETNELASHALPRPPPLPLRTWSEWSEHAGHCCPMPCHPPRGSPYWSWK